MTFYFLILFGLYFVLLVILRIGWSTAVAFSGSEPIRKNFFISVIIPVRNEERNMETLAHGLAGQTYASANFEIIMVDDHSSDNAIENCKGRLQNLTVLYLDGNETGKKAALAHGISTARGEIIATTDADCQLLPEWLTTINATFQQEHITMAAGLVAMADEKDFFSRWQAMEFASVIGTGTASFGLNRPMMCNGANLSFRKEIFQQVRGYEGNEHIASGDDEFLMQKFLRQFPGSVDLVNSIVITQPQESLKDFFYQRIRWASKWKRNSSLSARLLAVCIFLIQVSWIYFLLTFIRLDYWVFLVVTMVKLTADLVFLSPIFRFMKIKFRLLPFLGLQFFYPFYVIFVGILAPWSGYQWKGRKIL